MDIKHAFLDIETSGLDPVIHEPIEVAYILEPGNRAVNFSLPFNIDNAQPEALEVNGWGKREFPPAMSPYNAAVKIADDLRHRVILGNNVQFDMNFLRELMRRQGVGQPTWRYHVVDIQALAGGALGLEPPWKAEALCKVLGVPLLTNEAKHTALNDAEWNRTFYRGIYAYAWTQPAIESKS